MSGNWDSSLQFLDSSSYSEPSEGEQAAKQIREDLWLKLESIEDGLIQWHAGNATDYFIVSDCLIPHQLLDAQERTRKEMEREIFGQGALADEIMNLDGEIQRLESQITAASQTGERVSSLKESEGVQKATKGMLTAVSRLAGLQNNSRIEIKTSALEQQIERKNRSEETMVALYRMKIKQEGEEIERYRSLRRELERKIMEEGQLASAGEAQRKAAKDNKLIADRVAQLENSISLLKRVLGH